jgi:hypothetical protein
MKIKVLISGHYQQDEHGCIEQICSLKIVIVGCHRKSLVTLILSALLQ